MKARTSLPFLKDYSTFVLVIAHLLRNAHLYFKMKKPGALQERIFEDKVVSTSTRDRIISEFKEANKNMRAGCKFAESESYFRATGEKFWKLGIGTKHTERLLKFLECL